MPLAAPDYFAGSLEPTRGANVLFISAGWIRRRCNEILAEAALDVIKVYSLAEMCQQFRAEADRWRTGTEFTTVRDALVKRTQADGTGNATKTVAEINADYKALYLAAGTFLTWAAANLPPAGQVLAGATVTVNRTWPNPDATVTIVKPAPVTTQVTALRAVFD